MMISIIIPSFKPQGYIWECLDSIKNQTFSADQLETIIILNGCNEPYYSEISDYIQNNMQDCNIKLIQTDEGGVSNARNIGLNIAKGEYITFVDDDDYISPSYLQELYDVAIQGYLPLSNIIAFEDGSNKFVPYYITNVFKNRYRKEKSHILQVRSFFSIPVAKLITKDIIGDTQFNTNFQNGEDGLFMLQISDKINRIKFTSEKAIYFRRYRYNSLTTTKRYKKELLNSSVILIRSYLKVYLTSPFKYNILFVLTRILAIFKCI